MGGKQRTHIYPFLDPKLAVESIGEVPRVPRAHLEVEFAQTIVRFSPPLYAQPASTCGRASRARNARRNARRNSASWRMSTTPWSPRERLRLNATLETLSPAYRGMVPSGCHLPPAQAQLFERRDESAFGVWRSVEIVF